MYVLMYKYVSYFIKWGGGNLSSELINETFVISSLQIGAEHIPVCPFFVH